MFLVNFILKTLFNSLFFSSVMTLSFHVFSEQIQKFGPDILISSLHVVHEQLDKDQIKSENPNLVLKNNFNLKSDDKEKLNKIINLGHQIYRQLASENRDSLNVLSEKLSDLKINPIEKYNNKILEQKKIFDEIDQSSP